jgi:glutaminase
VAPAPAATPDPGAFVSTGRLPSPERVTELVETCHRDIAGVTDGKVSEVYPALAEADPASWGVAVVSAAGRQFVAGDVDVPFTVMSVAKPFVFALACERLGIDAVVEQVGVDATGLAFNSTEAVERGREGRTNPMVNAGAIACAGLLVDADGADGGDGGDAVELAWAGVRDRLSAFAGHPLDLDEPVHRSAAATNHRNRALANLLRAERRLVDPEGAVDLYTRASCLSVTARDLAVMGATLADGGVNPLTGDRVVSAEVAARTLAVMTTAGMYERSGEWLVRVGLPGKSGIGGGIVTAAPGKGGMGTFSPPLDAAGNSVRGVLAAQRLSRALGLDLFASPVVGPAATVSR